MPKPFPYRILFNTRDWIHRVHLQRVLYIEDDGGGNLTATVTLRRNVPCVINLGATAETQSNDRQQAEATHTLTFKEDPNLGHGDRVIYGDRLFVVTSVKDEYSLQLIYTVTCTEVVR